MNDERSKEFENADDRPGKRELSLLEAFDLVLASFPPDDRNRRELFLIRAEIAAQEETIGEAQQMIEKLEEVIKKVTSPANRIGTYLSNPARETAHIVVGGADYYCNVDPRISLAKLKKGTRVLVNEAFRNGGPGDENHGGARDGPAPGWVRTRIAVSDPPAFRRADEGEAQIRRRSSGRSELSGGAGSSYPSAITRALPRRRSGIALGESGRTGPGAASDQGRNRAAAHPWRAVPEISARDAERFSALRPARLR
jgi:proteasomal ATPase-like protein